MRTQHKARGGFVVLPIVVGGLLAGPAPAQEAAAQAPSLRWIPADAASYSVMLRNREQLEAILQSKAWARLINQPFAKKVREFVEDQWNTSNFPLGIVRNWYEQAGNAELVRFIGELFEEEVFIYSGKNAAEFSLVLQELQLANQFAPLTALFNAQNVVGNPGAANINNPMMRVKALLQVLDANADRLKVPDVLLGFKLSHTKPAEAETRIRNMEKLFAQAFPKAQRHLKRTKIHGADVHMLVVDGTVIPWESLKEFVDQEGQFKKLPEALKKMKLTLAFSIRGNYVLVGFGEGTAALRDFGDKLPNRLSGRSEMAPLATAAGRHLTSIHYVSKEYQKAASGTQPLEGMSAWLASALKEGNLPAEQRAKLTKRLEKLSADLKRDAPSEPGARLSFSYLNGQGYERYAYNWFKGLRADDAKPLTLLRHVGSHPLAVFVGQEHASPEDYELFVRLVKIGYQTVEQSIVQQLPDEVRGIYERFITEAKPLFARLDRATGKLLLPALGDEDAFVLDAQLKSKQWHQAMPPAEAPLPMLEPALVISVRDRAMLLEASREYRGIFNDFMALIRKQSNEVFPEVRIPEPKVKKSKASTLYYWPLSESLGLDKKITPTGGLSDNVAVLTISQDHAKRLLTETTWKGSGPLSDPARPLVSVAYFNWAGLVEAIRPWVKYGLAEADQSQEVKDQVFAVLDILKVLHTYSAATYVEGDAVVTHSQTVLRDLRD
jgi:hypothetical protein